MGETLSAVFALKGLLSSVDPFMLLQRNKKYIFVEYMYIVSADRGSFFFTDGFTITPEIFRLGQVFLPFTDKITEVDFALGLNIETG